MTLKHVSNDLAAKARAKPGDTHRIQLKRGLRLALRYRRSHYTLSMARIGVFPSVVEKKILRDAFGIPEHRKWRTRSKQQWRIWYIFWNPDAKARTEPDLPPGTYLHLPFAPVVGTDRAAAACAGDPT